MTKSPPIEPLMTRSEVAEIFRVDPKTVTRWARAGKLTTIRTLGGHRRFRESEVRALLAGISPSVPNRVPAPGVMFVQSPWPAGTAVRWDGGTFRVADRGGILFLAGSGPGGGFFPLLPDLDGIEVVQRAATHECGRAGCARQLPPRLLLCGDDWKLVPKPLQRAVSVAYDGGAGIGSAELLAAQEAAIRAVNGEPGQSAGGLM